MKAMSVWLTIALLSVGVVACGGTKERTAVSSPIHSPLASHNSTSSSQASTGPYLKDDGDKDSDDERHRGKRDDDDDRTLWAPYGNEATHIVRQEVTKLVRTYFAVAAGGDGEKACALLYGSLAAGLGEGQSQSVRSAGNACPMAVDRIFKERHQQLAADEVSTMVVTSVHVKGNFGLALLGFREVPEGAILIEREDNAWKIASALDSEIP
jgi:hypothetical protein